MTLPKGAPSVEQFADIFAQFFGSGPRSPAAAGLDITVSLEISARDAKRGCKREVEVSRRVPCATCARSAYRGGGCASCKEGFSVKMEKLLVSVPSGVSHGVHLRLKGKGHAAEDAVGDAYVTIAIAPPWWERARQKGYFGYAILAALPLGLAALYGWRAYERSKMPQIGAPCATNTDCASGQCLGLYDQGTEFVLPGGGRYQGFPTRTGGVCTKECEKDSDCPSSMTCAPIEKHTTLQGVPDLPPLGTPQANAFACSPR